MELLASCAFGLESIVTRELRSLGLEPRTTGPGQIQFAGEWPEIANANLWLRCADRVSIVVAEFACADFDTLFETVRAIDWPQFVDENARIHVTGGSIKSQLSSVPAIQRTVKKAIVERLLAGKSGEMLEEDGALHRVHIGLRDDLARLTIDTTGPSLHKRGYREISTKAPLKETLAAALVQLSFWNPERPLIDPFCGGGTILIEAAMLGRNMAPGLRRTFSCEQWRRCPLDIWLQQREQAKEREAPSIDQRLIGTDTHGGALALARRNAEQAGVGNDLHLQQRDFADLTSKREYGCVVTNPPYGDRMIPPELRRLYESMPVVLGKLPTWSHFILTSYPDFEQLIGRSADRRRKLYNGRIECTYYQFHGPRPNRPAPRSESAVQDTRPPSQPTKTGPVFGGLTEKDHQQAELFASRLKKRARHLRRWPTKRGITCYRLYERDIPEIPLVVDVYEDWLHIVEFERPHERDLARHSAWLDLMARTAGETLEFPPAQVVLKTRLRQRGLQQHEKLNNVGEELIVHEAGLRFLVNLTDFTDTGLFLDHRAARGIVRDMCEGSRVLNLFAYTGAFSVYAAAGGASEVTTVDWSQTYLDWAHRNFELNEFHDSGFRFIREDAREFAEGLPASDMFDIIVCDPPTFSNSKRTEVVWDVQRDHAELINRLLLQLTPDGTIFFSSNFRRIKFDYEAIEGSVREITKQTLPEDFRNQRIHRSWLIRHSG